MAVIMFVNDVTYRALWANYKSYRSALEERGYDYNDLAKKFDDPFFWEDEYPPTDIIKLYKKAKHNQTMMRNYRKNKEV